MGAYEKVVVVRVVMDGSPVRDRQCLPGTREEHPSVPAWLSACYPAIPPDAEPVFCSHVQNNATLVAAFPVRLHENSINELIADEH